MSKIIKEKIRQKIIAEKSNLFSKEGINSERLKVNLADVLDEIIKSEQIVISVQDKKRIIEELAIELAGFGPVDSLLRDPQITEIMINGAKKIYVERKGKTELTGIEFEDDNQIMYLIEKILAPTRRHVDEFYPYADVSLKDGSRVNIIIPPLALNGPTITIRKFLKELKSIEDLIRLNTLDIRMADFLVAAIKAKLNIIFSGATGAGKTTTLNVLSSYIANDERIVTIEDTAELHLNQDHWVRLEARLPSIEGKGEITIRDLFKNSLRMRPDRIILGEIRGQEALDMLQAVCSGHRGALSVIHANTPQEVIYRLETMILTSGVPISLEAIHRQIAAGVHIIIQQEQLLDGSRKITHIAQVNGLKDAQAVLEDIFYYDLEGVDSDGNVKGRWRSSGITPVFYPMFKKAGIDLSKDIFNKD
jgi:pilus assembly protein CpaF